MLLWTGSQEKGAGRLQGPGGGLATVTVLVHPETAGGAGGQGPVEALLLPSYSLVLRSVGWSQPKGDGLKKCQLAKGTGCQAEKSMPSEDFWNAGYGSLSTLTPPWSGLSESKLCFLSDF